MSQPGLIGNIAPLQPQDLGRRLAAIEAKLRQLETARSLEAATVGKGGVRVVDNGTITVVDSDGTIICSIGALPTSYNRSDGTAQPGFALYREDGSVAAVLADRNPTTPPYKQAWQ